MANKRLTLSQTNNISRLELALFLMKSSEAIHSHSTMKLKDMPRRRTKTINQDIYLQHNATIVTWKYTTELDIASIITLM